MLNLIPLPYRYMVYLAALIASVVAWKWYEHTIYQSGYEQARLEMQEEFYEDLEDSVRDSNKRISDASVTADYWRNRAVEEQSKPPRVVTKYVEKIIDGNPGCTELHGFTELWEGSRSAK